jgi:hypothetical protein
MLETYRIREKYDQSQIINSWEKIMGKTIAKRTTKIYFKGEVMVVQVKSAPLRQELNMSKSKVISLLQEEFGKDVINDVLFI